MINEQTTIDIKKLSVIYGVVLGIISFILAIISLILVKNATGLLTSSFLSGLVNYGVFIGVTCFLVIRLRRATGGYWDFSTALKNIFIMLAVSCVLSNIGTSVFNAVYPVLQEEAIDNMMNVTIESLEAYGAPDEQIDSTIEALEQQKELLGTISVGQILKGLAIVLIMYFVFALVLAAIFKKEQPFFVPQQKGDEAHPWIDKDGSNPTV